MNDLIEKKKQISENSKSLPFNIANNLKKLVTLANISEHELSRRTNIKQPIINRLLSGKNTNPKLLTLKPLADYFMLTVSQLIGEEEIGNVWKGFTSKNHKGWSEIPLLNSNKLELTSTQTTSKTVIAECPISNNTFAYYVDDQSMEPLFPFKSLAIIEPDLEPTDGDHILVKTEDNTFVLRNFLLRSGIKYVNPINSKFGSIRQLLKEEEILGTVVRNIFNYNFAEGNK